MNTWNDLKEKCENSERFQSLTDDQLKVYKKEIVVAKRFYENGRNLYDELQEKKEVLTDNYSIPYLLELTSEMSTDKKKYIQVKTGASGGIDIDTDWESSGREKIYEYLVEKYSQDQILHVGTFTSLGPKSAAKDLLRVYGVSFGESNAFSVALQSDLSWEENLKQIRGNHPAEWAFYNKHKSILDLVPDFLNKIRNSGKHAGGLVVLDKPVYNYIPVDRVSNEVVTAFPESGSETTLDECGVIKYDILGISILDVIGDTVDMITEDIYLIEDDDGLQKIVPASYIDEDIRRF